MTKLPIELAFIKNFTPPYVEPKLGNRRNVTILN